MKPKNAVMLLLTSLIWGTAFVAQSVGMDFLEPVSYTHLALVKRIVDSAGGTIKAENREYGGCRFVIELPKQKDEII